MSRLLTRQQAYLILNALPNIGPITTNRLLQSLDGDPRTLFQVSAKQLESVRGVGPAISQTILEWTQHFSLDREEQKLAEGEIAFMSVEDPAYPPALREIHDPPLGLYRKGPADLTRPAVAVVGSRRTTHYGEKVARMLAEDLVRFGFLVVSGLARGIDTAAHQGTLNAGGQTAAVLGNGLDIVYPPENVRLYREMEQKGCVLSEFPLGRRADRQSFAMRNRIVAGMAAALVVVESDTDGGSMITAKFAGDQGRHVFAVPGRIDQPSSAGCHQLIRDGATLYTGIDDLISELSHLPGFQLKPAPARTGSVEPEAAAEAGTSPISALEQTLLRCFAGGETLSSDAVVERSGRAVAEVNATLLLLEIKGWVARRPDGTFVQKR